MLQQFNSQAIAQAELNEYIEAQAEAIAPEIQVTTPEIEIDSDYDQDFGLLYRVWHSWSLLGTYYRAIDGKWVAQPCNSDERPRCNTSDEAQLLIVSGWEQLEQRELLTA